MDQPGNTRTTPTPGVSHALPSADPAGMTRGVPRGVAKGPTRSGPVALVAAVRDELMPLVHKLSLRPDHPWFRGQVGGQEVVAGVTGVGRRRAIEVFEALLEEVRPRHVVHVGFAGGLDPTLAAGSVVEVPWVIDASGQAVRIDAGRPRCCHDDPARRQGMLAMLTADRLVPTAAGKRQLFERHGVALVDLEAFHVARLAAQYDLGLTMLRAVSDPAGMDIPAEASRWVKPDGREDVPAALWHLLTRPWKIPMTVRLARNVRLAANNLAQRVQEFLEAGANGTAAL